MIQAQSNYRFITLKSDPSSSSNRIIANYQLATPISTIQNQHNDNNSIVTQPNNQRRITTYLLTTTAPLNIASYNNNNNNLVITKHNNTNNNNYTNNNNNNDKVDASDQASTKQIQRQVICNNSNVFSKTTTNLRVNNAYHLAYNVPSSRAKQLRYDTTTNVPVRTFYRSVGVERGRRTGSRYSSLSKKQQQSAIDAKSVEEEVARNVSQILSAASSWNQKASLSNNNNNRNQNNSTGTLNSFGSLNNDQISARFLSNRKMTSTKNVSLKTAAAAADFNSLSSSSSLSSPAPSSSFTIRKADSDSVRSDGIARGYDDNSNNSSNDNGSDNNNNNGNSITLSSSLSSTAVNESNIKSDNITALYQCESCSRRVSSSRSLKRHRSTCKLYRFDSTTTSQNQHLQPECDNDSSNKHISCNVNLVHSDCSSSATVSSTSSPLNYSSPPTAVTPKNNIPSRQPTTNKSLNICEHCNRSLCSASNLRRHRSTCKLASSNYHTLTDIKDGNYISIVTISPQQQQQQQQASAASSEIKCGDLKVAMLTDKPWITVGEHLRAQHNQQRRLQQERQKRLLEEEQKKLSSADDNIIENVKGSSEIKRSTPNANIAGHSDDGNSLLMSPISQPRNSTTAIQLRQRTFQTDNSDDFIDNASENSNNNERSSGGNNENCDKSNDKDNGNANSGRRVNNPIVARAHSNMCAGARRRYSDSPTTSCISPLSSPYNKDVDTSSSLSCTCSTVHRLVTNNSSEHLHDDTQRDSNSSLSSRFECPECHKTYSCRKNVKRHRMAVHKLLPEQLVNSQRPIKLHLPTINNDQTQSDHKQQRQLTAIVNILPLQHELRAAASACDDVVVDFSTSVSAIQNINSVETVTPTIESSKRSINGNNCVNNYRIDVDDQDDNDKLQVAKIEEDLRRSAGRFKSIKMTNEVVAAAAQTTELQLAQVSENNELRKKRRTELAEADTTSFVDEVEYPSSTSICDLHNVDAAAVATSGSISISKSNSSTLFSSLPTTVIANVNNVPSRMLIQPTTPNCSSSDGIRGVAVYAVHQQQQQDEKNQQIDHISLSLNNDLNSTDFINNSANSKTYGDYFQRQKQQQQKRSSVSSSNSINMQLGAGGAVSTRRICSDCNRLLSSDYSLKRHRSTCAEVKAKAAAVAAASTTTATGFKAHQQPLEGNSNSHSVTATTSRSKTICSIPTFGAAEDISLTSTTKQQQQCTFIKSSSNLVNSSISSFSVFPSSIDNTNNNSSPMNNAQQQQHFGAPHQQTLSVSLNSSSSDNAFNTTKKRTPITLTSVRPASGAIANVNSSDKMMNMQRSDNGVLCRLCDCWLSGQYEFELHSDQLHPAVVDTPDSTTLSNLHDSCPSRTFFFDSSSSSSCCCSCSSDDLIVSNSCSPPIITPTMTTIANRKRFMSNDHSNNDNNCCCSANDIISISSPHQQHHRNKPIFSQQKSSNLYEENARLYESRFYSSTTSEWNNLTEGREQGSSETLRVKHSKIDNDKDDDDGGLDNNANLSMSLSSRVQQRHGFVESDCLQLTPLQPIDDTWQQWIDDCVLIVADKRIGVSKSHLAKSSTYFASLFEFVEEENEIRLPIYGVDSLAFQQTIDVLKGTQRLYAANIDAVLELADRFKFSALYARCERFIVESLATSSIMHAIRLAEQYRMSEIKQSLFDSISIDVFRSLAADEDYRRMSAELKAELLEKWGTFL